MIVIDVETSGMSPERSSILSIGAVDFNAPNDTFYQECSVFPGAEISPGALRVNGFTNAQITDSSKPDEAAAVAGLMEWAAGRANRDVGGSNPSFDVRFLRAAGARGGVPWRLGNRQVPLQQAAYGSLIRRKVEIPRNLGLDWVLADVGLPAREAAHNALDDALLTAEAFMRYWRGTTLLERYADSAIPAYLVPK